MPPTDRIHTYFSPVPDLNLVDETKLLLLWRENWKAHGFETGVLNEWVARQHPYFDEYDAAISQFPSVNPKGYDRSCFIRWLAMAQIGGGIMSDFDLWNRGVPPVKPESIDWTKITVCERGLNGALVPSLVIASQERYMSMCEMFADAKPENIVTESGQPHYSDMLALQDLHQMYPDRFKVVPLVALFNDPGWEQKKLTHFSNGSTTKAGRTPRYVHVPQIVAEVDK